MVSIKSNVVLFKHHRKHCNQAVGRWNFNKTRFPNFLTGFDAIGMRNIDVEWGDSTINDSMAYTVIKINNSMTKKINQNHHVNLGLLMLHLTQGEKC
jgi:hypothetical protein